MDASQSKSHVVAFPYPAQGHINPMMQLSKRLSSKGFTVSFVITEELHHRLIEAQQNIDDYEGFDIRLVVVSDGLPNNFDRARNISKFFASINNMRGAFEGIMRRLTRQSPPASCMITDSFLPWTQDVADKFGIPRISFWTQSAAVYSIYALTTQLLSTGYNAFKDVSVPEEECKAAADFITHLPGLPPLKFRDLPYDFRVLGSSLDWAAQIIMDQFSRRGEAVCIVANTFDELESTVIEVLQLDVPFYPIGPLIPLDYLQGSAEESDDIIKGGTSLWEETAEEYREWLDDRTPRSVLYVSFGSAATVPVTELHELARGIMESGQPFIWVIRRNLYHHEVSEILPDGFLKRTKDQGIIVSWVSQLVVLSHAATGGFLSHCGWNSTLESISMGVPLLALPSFGDQLTNCRLIVDTWNVGLELKRSEEGILKAEEVTRKVKILMQAEAGAEMRRRAEHLREAARKAGAENEHCEGTLDCIVKEVIRRHNSE